MPQVKTIKIISISLMLLTAINAVIAGILFIIDPSGQKMGIDVSYLRHSPFHSFLLPGIVLFVVNGLFNFGAAYAVIKNRPYASTFTLVQGVLLVGWIVVQVLMVRDVSALHIIMFCIGFVLIMCGFLLHQYGVSQKQSH